MTKIEWVRGEDGSEGTSWNPLRAIVKATGKSAHHCEHINEACRFCYAERMNRRLGGLPFKPGNRGKYDFIVDQKRLLAPLHKRKPTRIFVESMSDASGDWWPDHYIDQLYAVMALTPWHTYINLSKRPERRRAYLSHPFTQADVFETGVAIAGGYCPVQWPLSNVIEGVSVSNQDEADEFVPILLNTPAACRVVSAEPLLGPIDFSRWLTDGRRVKAGSRAAWLDWIIVGGESGPKARPMDPQWARDIRDQCTAAGAMFFFKQWGEWAPVPMPPGFSRLAEKMGFGNRYYPCRCGAEIAMVKFGKQRAGRTLDGREWNEFPKIGELA